MADLFRIYIRLESSIECSSNAVRKHSSVSHMRFFSLSLLLLHLLLLLPCSRFFAYHTLLHFLHIISHASEPAKWQSEWGSLKSASIRQRNVVRKCFALFTFLLHSVEALLVVVLFVVAMACLLCLVVVLSVFWLRLSVSVSVSFQQDIRHPRDAFAFAYVRRACFGFWFYRFASCRATEPVALINKLSGVLTSTGASTSRRCSYSSWFA